MQNTLYGKSICFNDKQFEPVLRIALGIYILIMFPAYNIFMLMTRNHGYYELSAGEIIFFSLAIYGTIVCFGVRTTLYIKKIISTKILLYILAMLIFQGICILAFADCLIKMFHYTNAHISWNYLRIYNEFEFIYGMIFIAQCAGYLIGFSVKGIVESFLKLAKETCSKTIIMIAAYAIGIGLGILCLLGVNLFMG